MSATVHQLACQEVAGAVATTDREATADLVLDVAIKAAIRLYRQGRPGRAHYRLARALVQADRILGKH